MPETTEERTAKLEGIMEQMDKRLTNIEGELIRIHTRIDELNNQLSARIDQVSARIDQVNTRFDQVNAKVDQRFNWLMGIMITMWVSLIITMIFK